MSPEMMEIASELAPLLALRDRLRAARLDDDLELLLPVQLEPHLTSWYGIPVRYVPDLDGPRLAHRLLRPRD